MDRFTDDPTDQIPEDQSPLDVTVADLADARDAVPRENRALEPIKAALEAAGFYAYGTFDDQQRWTIAADDEAGRIDVRVGDGGFVVELWGSSPGLFADEENDWRRRAHERLARMIVPNIARGLLQPHQSAYWDEVDAGVAVRVRYEIPFGRAQQVGAFAREHLPELEDVITQIESQIVT